MAKTYDEMMLAMRQPTSLALPQTVPGLPQEIAEGVPLPEGVGDIRVSHRERPAPAPATAMDMGTITVSPPRREEAQQRTTPAREKQTPDPAASLSDVGSAQERWEATQARRTREEGTRFFEKLIPFSHYFSESDRMPAYQMEAESEAGRVPDTNPEPKLTSTGYDLGRGVRGEDAVTQSQTRPREHQTADIYFPGGGVRTRPGQERETRSDTNLIGSFMGVVPATVPAMAASAADLSPAVMKKMIPALTGAAAIPRAFMHEVTRAGMLPEIIENMSELQGGPLNRNQLAPELVATLDADRAMTHRLWSEGTLSDKLYSELVPEGERMRLRPRAQKETTPSVRSVALE